MMSSSTPLRVVLVGQSGPYAPELLRRLSADRGPWCVVAVVEGRRRNASGPLHRRVSPRIAALPRGDHLASLASALGIPTLQTRDINEAAAIGAIVSFDADVLLCSGFDRLFRADVLDAVAWGGLNLHPSMLPEWRGPAPLFWALREGRARIGVSIHRLDPREDHGLIYAQDDFARPKAARGEELYQYSIAALYPHLRRTLIALSRGRLTGHTQDESLATRAPRPNIEDARIVPEEWPCQRVIDFAVGAPFFCTPWMELGGDRFVVRSGLRSELGRRIPGHFAYVGNTVIVQCRDGVAHLDAQPRFRVDGQR
ncbi:MAG: formyltransferase family protein [Myxococcota bacterium]